MTADNGPQHRRGPGDLPGCGSCAPSARSAPACGAGRRAAARDQTGRPGPICPARLRELRSVPESDTGSSP